MSYRPIRTFSMTDPIALRSALERMDQGIFEAFLAEAAFGIRRMSHRRVAQHTLAKFDEVVEVETPDGDVVVTLPPITPQDLDRVVEIAMLGGGNDLIVRASNTISIAGGGTTEETFAAGYFGIIRYKACLRSWERYA